MRKQIKYPNSEILAKSLNYKSGNASSNDAIRDILKKEQKGFCAYTDVYINRTNAKDVEHFDPTLKDTAADGYDNWFYVTHQWNKEKSYKWSEFQPVLHPTAPDFEDRIIYFDGDYLAQSNEDEAAKNLIALLKLDDPILAQERKNYINRKKKEIKEFGESVIDFFTTLINDDISQISYLRAIKEEFGIDLWNSLP